MSLRESEGRTTGGEGREHDCRCHRLRRGALTTLDTSGVASSIASAASIAAAARGEALAVRVGGDNVGGDAAITAGSAAASADALCGARRLTLAAQAAAALCACACEPVERPEGAPD